MTTGPETLIICPKNLVTMWEDYVSDSTGLRAKVLSDEQRRRELPELRRYRLVLIDESHNLRNREGKRYRAIQEYMHENESKCILLSATPYNKTYFDLVQPAAAVRPGRPRPGHPPGDVCCRELGETEFIRRHQCSVRSLAAFEKSTVRRRLARADAALPGPAHAQLHPGQLRRHRSEATAAST